jgi:hypothetical protein
MPAARSNGFRIDTDLDHAKREAERVLRMLTALRARHDLTRYEYTRHVRVMPAGHTYSHPILTLSTRFADTEDQLLAAYLHEQMHWYLWRLDGLDIDPIAPFFDELVRRYPKAPTRPPDGARNYEQTYVHLVVNWLEIKAVSEFIGWQRAAALAADSDGYRWIYQTVLADWEALGELLEQHGIVPIRPAPEFAHPSARRLASGDSQKTTVAALLRPSRQNHRKFPGRGGKLRERKPAVRAKRHRSLDHLHRSKAFLSVPTK